MLQYAEECRTLGIPFIWDPGQQCARMSGDELRDGMAGATIVICNDYEFELIRQKTGLDEDGDSGAERRAGGHARRTRVLHHRASGRDGRAGRAAPPDRRSDRRRRRVPRRAPERPGARRQLPGVRADRQRGGDVCARTPGRTEPRLHVAGVSRSVTKPHFGHAHGLCRRTRSRPTARFDSVTRSRRVGIIYVAVAIAAIRFAISSSDPLSSALGTRLAAVAR